MEMTSLIESPPVSMSSSSGPTYDNVHPGSSSHDQVNVIGIYAQKNKTLETEVKNLQKELTKAKDMLKNVEKYWSQQVSTYYLHTLYLANKCTARENSRKNDKRTHPWSDCILNRL